MAIGGGLFFASQIPYVRQVVGLGRLYYTVNNLNRASSYKGDTSVVTRRIIQESAGESNAKVTGKVSEPLPQSLPRQEAGAYAKIGDVAPKPFNTSTKSQDVIYVTPQGIALPPGARYEIPKQYVENQFRAGCYGENVNGTFTERLRIDPATPAGYKGPNHSHYHLNGKREHYSPRQGDSDPGFLD